MTVDRDGINSTINSRCRMTTGSIMRFMVLGRGLYHSVYLIPTPAFSKGSPNVFPLFIPLRDTSPVVAEATRPSPSRRRGPTASDLSWISNNTISRESDQRFRLSQGSIRDP
jgi:hypothetical protein